MIFDANVAVDQGLLPMEFYDANGRVIKRKIKRCDTEAGWVESLVKMPNGCWKVDYPEGVVATRIETFPAPLTYKANVPQDELFKEDELWDLTGGPPLEQPQIFHTVFTGLMVLLVIAIPIGAIIIMDSLTYGKPPGLFKNDTWQFIRTIWIGDNK